MIQLWVRVVLRTFFVVLLVRDDLKGRQCVFRTWLPMSIHYISWPTQRVTSGSPTNTIVVIFSSLFLHCFIMACTLTTNSSYRQTSRSLFLLCEHEEGRLRSTIGANHFASWQCAFSASSVLYYNCQSIWTFHRTAQPFDVHSDAWLYSISTDWWLYSGRQCSRSPVQARNNSSCRIVWILPLYFSFAYLLYKFFHSLSPRGIIHKCSSTERSMLLPFHCTPRHRSSSF